MLLPMLAQQTETTSLTDFITDDEWVFEQKLDGHRLLLVSAGDGYPPTALTRQGTPYTRKLPKAIMDFRFPTGAGMGERVLDGEFVGGTFYAFDLPKWPSGASETATLAKRRLMLESFLAMVANPFKLAPQAKTRDEKIRLAEIAIKDNFEGLVLKRASSTYQWGSRGGNWLKVKFVTTAECVVTDVRADGKDSVGLGMYQWDGTEADHFDLIDVGRASLIGKEKAGLISKGDVIEVRYLYVGAGGRLYQPTIMRKRDDKSPEECTTGQMKYVNKKVLETL